MRTPSDVLKALGGPSTVARELGITSAATVVKWPLRRSIPAKYWPRLIALAKKRGVALDANTLLRVNGVA